MKTVKSHTLLASALGAALVAALSGSAFAMDPDEERLIRDGWKPQYASPLYEGTSLNVGAQGELGFESPRSGPRNDAARGSEGTSMRGDSELGFTDPRPGESSY